MNPLRRFAILLGTVLFGVLLGASGPRDARSEELDAKHASGGGATSVQEASKASRAPEMVFEQGWDIGSLAFSPDGKYLASGDTTGQVFLWDLSSRNEVWRQETPSVGSKCAEMLDLVFMADGKKLLVASDAHVAMVWDASNGHIRRTLEVPRANWDYLVAGVGTCEQAGKEVAVVKENSELAFWDPWTGKRLGAVEDKDQDAVVMRVARNGKVAALALRNGHMNVRELPSGQLLMQSHVRDGEPICSIAISPDGQYVITGGSERIDCWDVSKKEQLWSVEEHCVASGGLAISPDGSAIVCGGEHGRFVTREPRTGAVRSRFAYGNDAWNSFAVNATATAIAAGSEKGQIAIWSLQAEELKQRESPEDSKNR